MRVLTVVGIVLATARGAEPDPLKPVIKELKAALKDSDYDAVTKVLTHAIELRWNVEDKKLKPLLRAIGNGIKHEEPTIASASIRALVEMRIPGSSRYLKPRVAVPKKVGAKYWDVHLAAIAAAGKLQEKESISTLLKVVDHPKVEMALAAAEALGQYGALVPKERKKLVQRVADKLGQFEKKKPKGTQDRIRIESVQKTLVKCVRSLTGNRTLSSASEVRVWLRKGGKPSGPSNTSAPR